MPRVTIEDIKGALAECSMPGNQDELDRCETALREHPMSSFYKPSFEDFEDWVVDSICPTPDECEVESDGTCEHGYPSWMLLAGII